MEELERLYRERYAGFRNALATVTGSYDTARDAVQEGFARALANSHQFKGGSITLSDKARRARRERPGRPRAAGVRAGLD